MSRPHPRYRLILAFALVLAAQGRADEPGASERDDVAHRLKSVDQRLGEILDRHQRWKADGKLEDEDKRGELLGQAVDLFEPLAEDYSEALAAGMAASNATMTAAKAKLDELVSKFEPLGFWTCWRAEEPRIHETEELDNLRRNAALAEWQAQKGRIEDSRQTWEGVERIEKQLLEASKEAPDRPGTDATVNLDQALAYQRTKAEVERLRAACAPQYAKVDSRREEVAKDFSALEAALDAIQGAADGTLRNVLESGSGCEIEDLPKLEAFEKDLRPRVQAAMTAFAAKYPATDSEALMKLRDDVFGDTWGEYEAKFELGNDPFSIYEDLGKLSAAPAEIRKECAGRMAEDALRELDDLGDYAEGALPMVMVRINEKVELGMRYDPTHPEVVKAKAAMGPREAALRAGIEAATDAMRMPASIDDFEGPGDVAGLQAAATEFFAASPDWGKAQNPYILKAVAITGPWHSATKNILGETICWGVPYAAAFVRKDQPDPTIAFVYEGNLYTAEERGVAKAPPFRGYSHGDARKMRVKNLP